MEEPKHNPSYIPQIGLPDKNNFKERTATRAIYHRATAPGFFGVIVLCFFMSFINIKCGGSTIASYSGVDIILGTEKKSKYLDELAPKNSVDDLGMPKSKFEDATNSPARTRLFTTLALIAAVAGFSCVLLKGRIGSLIQICSGILGFLFLLTLQYYVKATVPIPYKNDSTFSNEYTTPMVTTEFALGYWIALFLFLSVGTIGIFRLFYHKRMNTS